MIHKRNFKETEVGPIPDTWEIKKIGDCCKLIRTSFKPSDEDIRKYIGLEHIEQYKLQLCGVGSSVDIKSNKLQFKSGQILFGKLRPYFRKIIRPKFDGVCSTDIFVIDSKKEYDNGFLFYFFANDDMVKEAIKSSEGTRMPRASWNYLSQIKKPFPPLPEQRIIAHILGTLDDKIELNRRMNETLEAMARAIFKSWFVDFDPVRAKAEGRDTGLPKEIADLFPDSFEETELREVPKGWKIKGLDEIAEYLNGLALQKYPPEEGKDTLPRIKIAQLKVGNTEGAEISTSEIPAEYIVKDGDVLFSWSGSLEVEIWCGGLGALNQHLFKVTSKEYPKWFYYLWTKYHLPAFRDIAAHKATTMGHIQRKHLSEAKVLDSNSDLLKKIDECMEPLIERIIANNIESRNLAELRDMLLPELISGELRVKNAEHAI